MKMIRSLYLLLMVAFAFPAAADAQIADNDASISVLAVQCAVSSGFSANEYEDYCRRLAKTLSLLSSAQQTRVFGYLPMPGVASLGEPAPEAGSAGSADGSAQTPAEASGTNELGANEATPATAPSRSNSLLNMVGRFNSLFDGTASASSSNGSTATPLVSLEVGASVGATTSTTATATVLGNSNTVTTTTSVPGESATLVAGTTAASGTSGTPSAGSTGGWSSLVSWFGAAEAAYKSGTLSSFLRGGN
jgi:hypothetical protein